MPPPSQLAISTSSLLRLVKEEASYHKELVQQESRIAKLEQQDASNEEDNVEFLLKQNRKALEETQAVFPGLRERIKDGLAKLQNQLESANEPGHEAPAVEVTKADDAIAAAKKSLQESEHLEKAS